MAMEHRHATVHQHPYRIAFEPQHVCQLSRLKGKDPLRRGHVPMSK